MSHVINASVCPFMERSPRRDFSRFACTFLCVQARSCTSPSLLVMSLAQGAEPHRAPMSRGRKNKTTSAPDKKAETLEETLNKATPAPTVVYPQPTLAKDMPVVEFVWPWGGDKVEVAGSWNNWIPVGMIYDQITRTHRVWIPSMPHGHISYKFIVDGQWRFDGHQPTTVDDFGNVNNIKEL